MILSFINTRKVPREMLKTSGFALGLQHLPRDLANVNEWKIKFDPYSLIGKLTIGKSDSYMKYMMCCSSPTGKLKAVLINFNNVFCYVPFSSS